RGGRRGPRRARDGAGPPAARPPERGRRRARSLLRRGPRLVAGGPRVPMNHFYRVTEGIRVSAQPFFLAEQSSAEEGRFVFADHIRIENQGEREARLVWRHWFIHDPVAGDLEVEGVWVVGETSTLRPGAQRAR